MEICTSFTCLCDDTIAVKYLKSNGIGFGLNLLFTRKLSVART